jgi:coenzyme F420-dependent glucose-6-phosphate dehydrogenase
VDNQKIKIGFHASHEQFAPSALVNLAVKAEAAGFDFIMSADHLNPWSAAQGHSGNTWTWLGSALQATRKIKFGTIAIPSGWRYHPVIIAQSAATLAEMHPDRLDWIAAGSGEALNETVVTPEWPSKSERNERLMEGIQIIRSLWKGQTVDKKDGFHYTHHAKIWSLPAKHPAIFGAALTPATAGYIAPWVDGLVTVYQNPKQFSAIVESFYSEGGSGKKIAAQIHLSWHPDLKQAIENAFEQWRANIVPPSLAEDLHTTEAFESAAAKVKAKDLDGHVHISSEANYFLSLIRQCINLKADYIILHNVGKNQEDFIEFFGSHVLPELNISHQT